MIVVNGWTVYTHPLLLDQLEKLTTAVEKAKAKDSQGWTRTANAKVLAAVRSLMFETVPSDPTRPEYRQGGTLGATRKHWFRAKFGNGRFRLFFRYDSRSKVIIFAWVNDYATLRTYGSKTDAYAVFKGMLDRGNLPYRPLADLRRKPVRRLARHGSILSGVGASGKPGVVQG